MRAKEHVCVSAPTRLFNEVLGKNRLIQLDT